MPGVSRRIDVRDAPGREDGVMLGSDAIRRGEVIVLPTDTVYGVGADAFDRSAVRAVLAAKGRGRDMPPPVLVASPRVLDGLAYDLPTYARKLVDAFWPGGLTLVCPAQPSLDWDLGADGTVAVRMPLHRTALALLDRTGPLAVTSANRTGQPAATTCDEAEEQLGEAVSVYLDAGPCAGSAASTIVDVTGERPRVLRVGALELDRLRTVVPDLIGPDEPTQPTEPVERPGSVEPGG
jgi:L-threonylcarbamoyladenylate synthase